MLKNFVNNLKDNFLFFKNKFLLVVSYFNFKILIDFIYFLLLIDILFNFNFLSFISIILFIFLNFVNSFSYFLFIVFIFCICVYKFFFNSFIFFFSLNVKKFDIVKNYNESNLLYLIYLYIIYIKNFFFFNFFFTSKLIFLTIYKSILGNHLYVYICNYFLNLKQLN
jgi:hypothetical protein